MLIRHIARVVWRVSDLQTVYVRCYTGKGDEVPVTTMRPRCVDGESVILSESVSSCRLGAVDGCMRRVIKTERSNHCIGSNIPPD